MQTFMKFLRKMKKKSHTEKTISVAAATAGVIVIGLFLLKLIADKQSRIDY